MVLLFTATLFAICGAFPTYEKISRGQQSNEFCATLVHPQNDSAAYVHLCYTPRKGNTRCLSVKSTPTSAFEFSPRNSHVEDSMSNHLRQNVWHAHSRRNLQSVRLLCLSCFIGRILHAVCYLHYYFCFFSSTTVVGTCIVADLPRCLPSTMQNATPMTVTLSSEEHAVLFSATSCEPGKQCSQPN